jgi:hypothetical protein
VHNKFSVRYYLNLVLVDEEDRRQVRGGHGRGMSQAGAASVPNMVNYQLLHDNAFAGKVCVHADERGEVILLLHLGSGLPHSGTSSSRRSPCTARQRTEQHLQGHLHRVMATSWQHHPSSQAPSHPQQMQQQLLHLLRPRRQRLPTAAHPQSQPQ